MAQKKVFRATLYLPTGGKQKWTDFMQANVPIPDGVDTHQPIVMATARFSDGTWVAGGVMKSETSAEFNIKFYHVFDKHGHLIIEPRPPIDPSDHEDFHSKGCIFYLNDDETVEYHLAVTERIA